MRYFADIKFNNNKNFFNEHKTEYVKYVKTPLFELYNDLADALIKIDKEIDFKIHRCVSTPYTDACFSRENPIKEYMYIHFKLFCDRKTDIPGFFFDASPDNVRFGFRLYKQTAAGMDKIRCGLLDNIHRSLSSNIRTSERRVKQQRTEPIFYIKGSWNFL